MVNMVGFHHREPEYNTAIYGEPGHYLHILPRPREGMPRRAYVTYPCGRSLFLNERDALHMERVDYQQGPAARFYIRWLQGGAGRIEYGQPGYEKLRNRGDDD